MMILWIVRPFSWISAMAAVVAMVSCAHAAPPATRPASEAGVRVGTYDSRAVVVAYVASESHGKSIRALQEQLTQAEARGDRKLAEQIKARGKQQQVLRHMQGFSIAPIDDVLAGVKDQLPGIAREAGVSLIVRDTDYAGAEVATVDVTDALVKLFNPSEKTLKTIAELRKHTPIPLIEALKIED